MSETDERPFNWKVLLENYSENYHTPFVHPEIDTSVERGLSDGLRRAGAVRVGPAAASERIARRRDPGHLAARRARLGGAGVGADGRPYGVGGYLTVWPNLMMNVFPGAVLAMWMEPIDADTTRVERRFYIRPEIDDAAAASHRRRPPPRARPGRRHLYRVQRSHNAGLDADGVLATVEERGVYFIHEHLRNRLKV